MSQGSAGLPQGYNMQQQPQMMGQAPYMGMPQMPMGQPYPMKQPPNPYQTDDYSGSFNKPPMNPQTTAEYYQNLPSVPPTSGVASLLHHQAPGSIYQGQAKIEEERQKRLFFREKERERRRLGLSAPDNYGGAKEKQMNNFHIRPNADQANSLNRNQESPINIPGKIDTFPMPNYYQGPPPQQSPFYDPVQQFAQPVPMHSPPPMMYPPPQSQIPPFGYTMPMSQIPPLPLMAMPPPGYQEYPYPGVLGNQRAQTLRQLPQYPQPPQPPGMYNQPPLQMMPSPLPLMGMPQQVQGPGAGRGQRYGNNSVEPRETFFDKFGQEEQDKRMASLVHQEKAKRLRDELQQQIDEKNRRKEEEKLERERWEMKYGGYDTNPGAITDPSKHPHGIANQPIYYPPGQPGQAPLLGNPFGPPPGAPQQQHHDFMNNSFSGNHPPASQFPAQTTPQPPQQMMGIGALPTLNNYSPNRNNQNTHDEYKRELEKQIEEKKKKQEEEKRKKQQEDEREEARLRKEQEELNRRYRSEFNENTGTQQQQQQQKPNNEEPGGLPPINEENFDEMPIDRQGGNVRHSDHFQSHRNNYYNQEQSSRNHQRDENNNHHQYNQQQSANFSEYRDDQQQYNNRLNNQYGQQNNNKQLKQQNSRKIEVNHPPIDFNAEQEVGPDSYPQMYDNYNNGNEQHQNYDNNNNYQYRQPPPPPPQMMMQPVPQAPQSLPQDPFQKQFQQQLQTFQKEIMKVQHQQKQLMKNYQKEIEQLQIRKNQIVSEMKNDQESQIKQQIVQLQNVIENLTRKMSRNDQPRHNTPPPPQTTSKHELVAEIIHELKNVLPLQYNQYPHSQSPPHHHQMPLINQHYQTPHMDPYIQYPATHQMHQPIPYYNTQQQQHPSHNNQHAVQITIPPPHKEHSPRQPLHAPPPTSSNQIQNPSHFQPSFVPMPSKQPIVPASLNNTSQHIELPSTTQLMSKFPEFEAHHFDHHNQQHHHLHNELPPNIQPIQEDQSEEEEVIVSRLPTQELKKSKEANIQQHPQEEPKAILPHQVRQSQQNIVKNDANMYRESFQSKQGPQSNQLGASDHQPVGSNHSQSVQQSNHSIVNRTIQDEIYEQKPVKVDKSLSPPDISNFIQPLPKQKSTRYSQDGKSSQQEHNSPKVMDYYQESPRHENLELVSPRLQNDLNVPGPIRLRNQVVKKDQKPPMAPTSAPKPGTKDPRSVKQQLASPSRNKQPIPKPKTEEHPPKKLQAAAQVDQKSRGNHVPPQKQKIEKSSEKEDQKASFQKFLEDQKQPSPVQKKSPQQSNQNRPTSSQQQHFGFKGGKNLSPEQNKDLPNIPGTSHLKGPTVHLAASGQPVVQNERPTTSQIQVNPREAQKEAQRPTTSQTKIPNKSPPKPEPKIEQKGSPQTKQQQPSPVQQRPTSSQIQIGGGRPGQIKSQKRPTTSQQQIGGRPTTSQQQIGGRPTTSQQSGVRGQLQAPVQTDPRANLNSQGGSRPPTQQVNVVSQPRVVPPPSQNVILEETEPEIDIEQSNHQTDIEDLQAPYIKLSEDLTKQAILQAQDSLKRMDDQKEREKIQRAIEKWKQDEEDYKERKRQEKLLFERQERLRLQEIEKLTKAYTDQAMQQALESVDRLKKQQTNMSKVDFDGISKTLVDQAMNSALESVERMQEQMKREDKIFMEKSLNLTQLAISDALESIRRLNEKIEAKKQAEAQVRMSRDRQLPTNNMPSILISPNQEPSPKNNQYYQESPQQDDENIEYEQQPDGLYFGQRQISNENFPQQHVDYHYEQQDVEYTPPHSQGGYQLIMNSSAIDQQKFQNPSMEYTEEENQHYAADAYLQPAVSEHQDHNYYPSGSGAESEEVPDNRASLQYPQMRINVAPPPEERISYEQHQLDPVVYQPIAYEPAVNHQPIMSNDPFALPENFPEIIEDEEPPVQQIAQNINDQQEPIHAPWRNTDNNNGVRISHKSVKFVEAPPQRQDSYHLSPVPQDQQSFKESNLEENQLIIEQRQHDLQQYQLYSELQMMERQIARDMNEQITPSNTSMQQQQQDVRDQVSAFPDPTNFLYNRYLVDNGGPEVYYKPNEDDMSPRTRFFIQNKNAPQYALYSKEADSNRQSEDQPIAQVSNRPSIVGGNKPPLSLNQMMLLRQQQQNMPDAPMMSNSVQAQLAIRPHHLPINDPDSTEDEKKQIQKKLADINRITNQYEVIQKVAEETRAKHENEHVEEMTQYYIKNFQKTEEILQEKDVRQPRPQVFIGEPENQYMKADFSMTEEQKRLYRPPDVPQSNNLRVSQDDASNAKPRFMRSHDEEVKRQSFKPNQVQPYNLANRSESSGPQYKIRDSSANKRNSKPGVYESQDLQYNKNDSQNMSSEGGGAGLLNIADPLSSLGEGRNTQRSGISFTQMNSPSRNRLQPLSSANLPDIQSNRPQTGVKLLRQMTKDSQQQQKAKPPLPPLPTKTFTMQPVQVQSRNHDGQQFLAQQPNQQQPQTYQEHVEQMTQYQYMQMQQARLIPPIRQVTQSNNNNNQSENESQTSIINIFMSNEDVHISQQQQQNQMQLLPHGQTSSTDRMSQMFERAPSQKQQNKNDPFALRNQLQEKLYETSQMMRVDNSNLILKVQEMTKSLNYMRPVPYDPNNSLPPIIDLAQRNNSNGEGQENGSNSEEVKADGGPEGFRQLEQNRTGSRRNQTRYQGGEDQSNNLQQQSSDDIYNNFDAVREVMNRRMQLNTIQSVTLPPIQGGTIAQNQQIQNIPPVSQGRNSQRLLDYLRDENSSSARRNSEESKTRVQPLNNDENQRQRTQPTIQNRTFTSDHNLQNQQQQQQPRIETPSINQRQAQTVVVGVVPQMSLPQHESPRQISQRQHYQQPLEQQNNSSRQSMNQPIQENGSVQDHHYSSHYEEESKHDGNNDQPPRFTMPLIVEHTVETPRNVFLIPQMSTTIPQRSDSQQNESITPLNLNQREARSPTSSMADPDGEAPTVIHANNQEIIYEEPQREVEFASPIRQTLNNNNNQEDSQIQYNGYISNNQHE